MIFIKLLYSGNMEYSWGEVWTVGHLDSVARLHRPDIQQTRSASNTSFCSFKYIISLIQITCQIKKRLLFKLLFKISQQMNVHNIIHASCVCREIRKKYIYDTLQGNCGTALQQTNFIKFSKVSRKINEIDIRILKFLHQKRSSAVTFKEPIKNSFELIIIKNSNI